GLVDDGVGGQARGRAVVRLVLVFVLILALVVVALVLALVIAAVVARCVVVAAAVAVLMRALRLLGRHALDLGVFGHLAADRRPVVQHDRQHAVLERLHLSGVVGRARAGGLAGVAEALEASSVMRARVVLVVV